MMTKMNSLGLNPHVRLWGESILVRPGSEAGRDTEKNKRPAVTVERWAQSRLLTFGLWGIGPHRERRGGCPNSSICYPLPLAATPHPPHPRIPDLAFRTSWNGEGCCWGYVWNLQMIDWKQKCKGVNLQPQSSRGPTSLQSPSPWSQRTGSSH